MMRLTGLLAILFFSQVLSAQLKSGHWRVHLPYVNGEKVISTNDKVYCLADKDLFYFNKNDESLNHLSTVQGLSDINITAIAFDFDLNMLVVGYENGNIDLLDKNGVFNISAIERKIFPGSKKINNICIENKQAYLATDFAMVALNLENKEIKDTYFIGENGSQLQLIDIALDNQYVYALLSGAIIRADKNSEHLIDFNQWAKIYEESPGNGIFRDIEYFNGELYLIRQHDGFRNDSMFVYRDNALRFVDLDFAADYYSIKAKNDKLIVSRSWSSSIVNKNMEVENLYQAGTAIDGDFDEDGTGWVAAQNAGLIRYVNYHKDTLNPIGPKNKGAYNFSFNNGYMYVAGGRPSFYWERLGMHYFINEQWHTIDGSTDTAMANIGNISKLVVDPGDPDHMFGGSFGYGLVEFQNRKVIKVYNEYNSVLEPMVGYEDEEIRIYVRITGMGYDSRGNLFLAVSGTKRPLYVLTNEGEMIQIETKSFDFSNSEIMDILVSSNDYLWVLLKNKGIFMYDIAATPGDFTDDREKKFTVVNQDGTFTNDVVSIAQDLNGYIWVGTGSGPVYYSSDQFLFDQSTPVAQQIILNDFDGLPQYLLGAERVTSITIDGANQKWLGTANSGAYLLSPDGYREILHFTKENSPLFDNYVSDIGVNHKTGEVFFGSDFGLISYRAGATQGISGFGKVYVFPNPVRPGFDGDISITGLASNVNVKITDVSGNLVYETTALGGTALWNGKNFDGKKPATGVYLVFCTNEDGSETFVTKMVFVN